MHTKAPPPVEHLAGRATLPIVEAYFEINHLKGLLRQGWLRCGLDAASCESVAEHSFGVAMLAMLVADAYYPELDRATTMRMALLHDIGEIYAGDITPYHGVDRSEKKRRERESVVRVLAKLPGAELYLRTWEEYEAGESAEARFVHAMDRLELVLQATIYEHRERGDLSEFFDYIESALSDPRLAEIVEGLRSVRRQR
jgi:putative hydrolases of HD superfamily